MLLDEELNKVYEENKDDIIVCHAQLLEVLIQRLNTTTSPIKYILNLKRMDYVWKLFCKTHPQLDKHYFRDYVKKCDEVGKITEVLGW